MKKFLFVLLAVWVATTNLTAQVASDVVIYKGTDIDPNGKADDNIWKDITPVDITNVFNYEEPTVTSFFKMFYTDEYIYVLVDVTDDVHYPAWLANDVKNQWKYDKVEIYFDINDNLKDGQGPAYIDGVMAPGHYQIAPALTEEGYGEPFVTEGVLYGTMSDMATVCYDMKPDGKGYVVECQIPIYAFVNDKGEELDVDKLTSLPQGMGFDVIIVDNDNDGKGRKRAVWKNIGPTEPYNNMDACGVITFSTATPSGLSQIDTSSVYVHYGKRAETVAVKGDCSRVVFIAASGSEVKTAETNISEIDVTDLQSGLYLLKLYYGDHLLKVVKIVK